MAPDMLPLIPRPATGPRPGHQKGGPHCDATRGKGYDGITVDPGDRGDVRAGKCRAGVVCIPLVFPVHRVRGVEPVPVRLDELVPDGDLSEKAGRGRTVGGGRTCRCTSTNAGIAGSSSNRTGACPTPGRRKHAPHAAAARRKWGYPSSAQKGVPPRAAPPAAVHRTGRLSVEPERPARRSPGNRRRESLGKDGETPWEVTGFRWS